MKHILFPFVLLPGVVRGQTYSYKGLLISGKGYLRTTVVYSPPNADSYTYQDTKYFPDSTALRRHVMQEIANQTVQAAAFQALADAAEAKVDSLRAVITDMNDGLGWVPDPPLRAPDSPTRAEPVRWGAILPKGNEIGTEKWQTRTS